MSPIISCWTSISMLTSFTHFLFAIKDLSLALLYCLWLNLSTGLSSAWNLISSTASFVWLSCLWPLLSATPAAFWTVSDFGGVLAYQAYTEICAVASLLVSLISSATSFVWFSCLWPLLSATPGAFWAVSDFVGALAYQAYTGICAVASLLVSLVSSAASFVWLSCLWPLLSATPGAFWAVSDFVGAQAYQAYTEICAAASLLSSFVSSAASFVWFSCLWPLLKLASYAIAAIFFLVRTLLIWMWSGIWFAVSTAYAHLKPFSMFTVPVGCRHVFPIFAVGLVLFVFSRWWPGAFARLYRMCMSVCRFIDLDWADVQRQVPAPVPADVRVDWADVQRQAQSDIRVDWADFQRQAQPGVRKNWADVRRQALARLRNDNTCAICFDAMDCIGGEGIALLSCTHIFHERCIAQCEQFCQGSPICPACRAKYLRRQLQRFD